MGNALIEGGVCAQFGHPRQAADGLMLEQITGTEGDACLARPADHLNGDDRVAAQREEALHSALARAGVDALELSTADDLAEAVMRFAELRRQRTRTGGGHTQLGMPLHLRPRTRSRDNGAPAS